VSLDRLKCTILAYYISALRGCCALKFLHAIEIHQNYLAHTPAGTGVPAKKKLSWKLKIWPKIQRVRLNNFRASGSILTGLSSVDASQGRGDKMGTIFTMPAPKNLWRQKIVHNFSLFLTTFDFDREYLRNGSSYQKSEKLLIICNPSHVRRKNLLPFSVPNSALNGYSFFTTVLIIFISPHSGSM